MTPEQWFAESNPDALLALVGWPPGWVSTDVQLATTPATLRRLRLFAVACARMVWDYLPTDARSAVLISERFAEGRASEADLRAAGVRIPPCPVTFHQHAVIAAGFASVVTNGLSEGIPEMVPLRHHWRPAEAARSAAKSLATRVTGPAPRRHPIDFDWHDAWNRTFHAARATQAAIFRDIFPPPGHAAGLRPDWLTSTVVAVARQMDATGDFSATPILADALQDAGCDDETVLQCCRAAGDVHVRGNWVVDRVLGRS